MSETSLQGARVLIAEDEALVALYAETVLEAAGAQIVGITATIAATRRAIESETTDLVLLDLKLQDGESYPIADLLMEKQIPFVFHTGHGDRAMLSQRYPGTKVLTKPTEAGQLLAAVRPGLRAAS